jgi:flagellar L-ring protein precursor FlgH
MRRAVISAVTLASVSVYAQNNPAQNPPTQGNSGSEQRAPDDLSAADLLRTNGGSLLRASLGTQAQPAPGKTQQVSFFDVPAPEPREYRKHDLITIIVREESEFKSDGTTDVKREAALDAKIEQFIKLAVGEGGIGSAVGETTPEIKMSGNRDFKGEASIDRSDSFVTRITAEIVDVKPNGTLVVQARSRIKTDDEEQLLVLSGTCRAEDVTADNSVLSTQLFDKDLTKTHKGAVRDGTKRGWFTRLLDALNPF